MNQSINCNLNRCIHDSDTPDGISAVLDEQRNIEYDDCIGAEVFAHSFSDRPADCRVHEGVQFLHDLGIREHDCGKRKAIEGAVLSNDSGAKPLHDRFEHRGPRLLQFACQSIGIDDHCPLRGQASRHGRLARTDPTSKPHDDHATTVASNAATIATVMGEQLDQSEDALSHDGPGETRHTGSAPASTTSEPTSWPLVERRRSHASTFIGVDRRLADRTASAKLVATVQAAPLMPFRIAALIGAAVRGFDAFSKANWELSVATGFIAAYTLFAIFRPVPYRNDNRTRLRVVVELALVTGAVLTTGGWSSPLAVCLVPTCMLAGFVGGTIFSAQLGAGAAAVITLQYLKDVGAHQAIRESELWIGLLLLVAVTSGVSHRASLESARHQQAALDRVGRLAEANALLFSLQRIAQTLPASLDLQDVLDSTVARVQSLIDHSMLTILLHNDITNSLTPARIQGYTLEGSRRQLALPDAAQEALRAPKTVRRDNLSASTAEMGSGSDGLGPGARSGLYAALRARGVVIGIIAVESLEPGHFGQQQVEILHGLAEPFGIAIDNARLFKRLRIASADEERNRIARDIHDDIGSSLAFLGFEIDRSITTASRGDSVDTALKDLRIQVSGMISNVRETLYDLRSDVSETQDLSSTLKQFVDRVRIRSGLEIEFESNQSMRLSIAQERELWHIAREALINVERHAQATTASVRWVCKPSHAILTIRDNGVGLTPDAARIDSYGMMGMRERAASIGAQLTTESSPSGTVIRVGLRQPQGARQWD